MGDNYKLLEDLIRNSYSNLVWTHKIQEKQAEIYENRYKVLTTINIVAAALTSAGVLSVNSFDCVAVQRWIKFASAMASFATAATTACLASFDYKSMAKSNKTAATKLVALRDEILILLAKTKFEQQPCQELHKDFYAIQERIHNVYSEAPHTTNQAVRKASDAIKVSNDGIYTDEEIDQLLPSSLRRRKD